MDIAYVQTAEVLPEYVLRLTFENGIQVNVDFGSFPAREGVFAKLSDPDYFESVEVVDGALTWGNGELDIAPETLYARATGAPLPPWMRKDPPDIGVHDHHEPHDPTGR